MSAHYYSPMGIDDHALWYVRFVQSKGRKDLLFYPKKKSAVATSNKFRRRVLELLLVKKMPYGERPSTWLLRLEKFAKEAGFTLTEVDLKDYE